MFSTSSLSFAYPGSEHQALSSVNIRFGDGEVILLTGANGSGKSTLIRALTGIAPKYTGGQIGGEVRFKGKPISEIGLVNLAGNVGIVLQDPEAQVTNLTVWEEVTFGPRNLGLPVSCVVAQAKNALVATGLLGKEKLEVLHLSGGQLQRLSIAALLAMEPEVLILDEPTANLDPLGIAAIVQTLDQLQQHVKLIVIASHWLEPFLDLATRIVVMGDGKIALDFVANEIAQHIVALREMKVEIPHMLVLQALLGNNFQGNFQTRVSQDGDQSITSLTLNDVSYIYDNGFPALRGVTTSLTQRRQVALLGRNGAGKTTLGRIMVSLIDPTCGLRTSEFRRPSLLLQRPTLGFLGRTVYEELTWGLDLSIERIDELFALFNLSHLQDRSPFSLSGGEQRRLALAVAVAIQPDLLILDEPSAGLDAAQVQALIRVLENQLNQSTILHITHDSRIVSRANRVIVLENGAIVADETRYEIGPKAFVDLGYDLVNPSLALAIANDVSPLPLHPDEIEVVSNASCV